MLVNHLEWNLVCVWAKQLEDCFPGWPCRSPIQSHGEVGNWGLSHLRILTRVERRRCSRNPQKALCFKQVQFQYLRKRQISFSACIPFWNLDDRTLVKTLVVTIKFNDRWLGCRLSRYGLAVPTCKKYWNNSSSCESGIVFLWSWRSFLKKEKSKV